MKRLLAVLGLATVLAGCASRAPYAPDPFFGRTVVPPPGTGCATAQPPGTPYYGGTPSVTPGSLSPA
ncbi:MAG: flagellar assembly peptidoglycan hydrolase FlgJ, partial [Planctomycetia bacterium]|nr:flagellar assembly peptidoglycan hydrolase FlgJ [Planctomycetia bacterium]